jgi:hypothetical protein
MSDSENDISPSKILDWLEKQGYSLEMRVAQIFRRAGFAVSQFENYIDPESHDLREIDIVASLGRQVEGITLVFRLLIECRYAKKPWAIFVSEQRSHPFDRFSHVLRGCSDVFEWQKATTLQGRIIAKLLADIGRNDFLRLTTFFMPGNIGYAVTETLRSDPNAKDNAYIAVKQITKCLEANTIENEQDYHRSLEDSHERQLARKNIVLYCNIAVPVIIVKGSIYECSLDRDSRIAASKNTNVVLAVTNKDGVLGGNKVSTDYVQLITEEELETYAMHAFEDFSYLLSREQSIVDVYNYEKGQFPRSKDVEIPF